MSAGGAVPAFAALAPAPRTCDGTCQAVAGTGVTAPATPAAPAAPAPGTTSPVPGTDGTAPACGTGLVPAPVPVQRAGAVTLALRSLHDHVTDMAQNQKRHRTFWHAIWHAIWVRQPEALTAHRDYIRSRSWLEPWMTGWVRTAFEWENVLYGVLVARPVKAACQNVDKVFERQHRLWITAGIVLAGFIIWLTTH